MAKQVKRFVRYLHERPFQSPYSVKEVIKSGSLGKGTAVRDLADIDLVVFVNGLTSIDDLKEEREDLLEDLEDHLRTTAKISPEKSSKYSLTYDWHDIKVDILPAVDVLSLYGSPRKVYDVMGQFKPRREAAQQFSASLAPLQRDFVKEIPEYVKKVIRLVKLWKEENSLEIRSYSIELLTIFVWTSNGEENPGTDNLFRKVMRKLATCETLQVGFDDNYKCSAYPSMSPPYIRDPANPYMNTLERINSLDEVSDCARRVLQRL